jgi:hypothetical protein
MPFKATAAICSSVSVLGCSSDRGSCASLAHHRREAASKRRAGPAHEEDQLKSAEEADRSERGHLPRGAVGRLEVATSDGGIEPSQCFGV